MLFEVVDGGADGLRVSLSWARSAWSQSMTSGSMWICQPMALRPLHEALQRSHSRTLGFYPHGAGGQFVVPNQPTKPQGGWSSSRQFRWSYRIVVFGECAARVDSLRSLNREA